MTGEVPQKPPFYLAGPFPFYLAAAYREDNGGEVRPPISARFPGRRRRRVARYGEHGEVEIRND